MLTLSLDFQAKQGVCNGTVELVRQIRGYDTITVSIFTPYRGTVLRNVAVKNNWLDKDHVTIHTTSSSVLNMPEPYLNSKQIDGLMRTIPLYVFSKSEWANIQLAENDDEKGNEIYSYYSEIYKREFLKILRMMRRNMSISGTGCKSNPKDSFKFVEKPVELSNYEIEMLTIQS